MVPGHPGPAHHPHPGPRRPGRRLPFLTKLNEGGDTVPGVKYTVLATKYDEVVTPYRSQFLSGSGVHNVLLQDLCALDLSEHVAIGLFDRIAFHEVANALDPAHATPTTCASAFS